MRVCQHGMKYVLLSPLTTVHDFTWPRSLAHRALCELVFFAIRYGLCDTGDVDNHVGRWLMVLTVFVFLWSTIGSCVTADEKNAGTDEDENDE